MPPAAAKAAAARIEAADSPRAYLLAVMRDPHATPERRDRAAQVLMPFFHPRSAGTPSSYNYVAKRDEAAKKARWSGYNSPWWTLLHSEEERAEREAELRADPELRQWVEAEAQRTTEADEIRHPVSEPEVAAKSKAAENARWEKYLADDDPKPTTDWTDPATGRSDLEFNPRGYRYPPDDE